MKLARTLPLKGRMHNVYVTPDGKYAVAGSVRHKFLSTVDMATNRKHGGSTSTRACGR